MKLENKKFLKEIAIILIVGIIVNTLCFFMGTCYVKAESLHEFPYYCINDTYNTSVSPYLNGIVESVKDKWYEQGDDPFVIVMGEVFWNDDSSDPYWCAECYVFWEVEFDDIPGADYTSRDYLFHSNSSGNAHRFDIWLDTYRIYSYDNRLSGDFHMLGNYNIHNTDIGTYTYGYPIYVSEPITTQVVGGNLTIIANNELQDPNSNLFGQIANLPPIDDILNGISGSYTPSSNNNFPTYDSSLSIGENLENYIDWLGNSLTNALNNLGNSISNYFNNLTNNLQNWLSSINNNIYNGFKNFNDNLKGFFKPFLDKFKELLTDIKNGIDYILEPIDLDKLADNLNNGSFSSDLLGVINSVQTFSNSFSQGSEPNTCSFTLDFSNAFYNFGVCTFSLDWLLPIRPIIRLFLGGLCVYSLIVSIFTSLNTYIGGTSSINDDI